MTIPLLDPGGESDNRALKLSTRQGNHIRNFIKPEWSPQELREALRQCREAQPNIKEIRSSSGIYNCVGMVFASRRTWVEPDEVEQILREDGYTPLAGVLQDAKLGDVVVYRNDRGKVAHVGIIIRIIEDHALAKRSYDILSKWGPWAEIIHEPDYVLPNFGRLTEVWTDRRDV